MSIDGTKKRSKAAHWSAPLLRDCGDEEKPAKEGLRRS